MTYWRLYYHLVWATKDRMPMILPELEADVYRLVIHKARELDAIVYLINGMPDHLHIAASIPPQIAISDFVKHLKGNSSHAINQNYGHGTLLWQPGYGVVSFGQKHLDNVVAYIRQQKEHHNEGTSQRFLEECSRVMNGPPVPH